MYNIDLSFLQSNQIDVDPVLLEEKFNEILQNKVMDVICSDCDSCIASTKKSQVSAKDKVLVEALCKGLLGHHFCEISSDKNIEVSKGDSILVNLDDCLEIAEVTEVGKIVNARFTKMEEQCHSIPQVLRKCTEEDMEKYRANLYEEQKARPIFREKVEKFQLNMKLVDIHYQFDKKKLYFFYTSDGRVDFRELAKDLASRYKTRIELRQIGVRDEAKRIGGMGTCGREYCCKSFLNNFKRITTQIANEQNLSSNMSKLSGPCGKLKCCLSFEINYEEVLASALASLEKDMAPLPKK